MLFETKKIQIETLSEYLLAVRSNLNLSAEEVSKKTGITLKFLTALESGRFKVLPADVYVLGFLRQLAEAYSVDAEELSAQYKKEKGIEQQVFKQSALLNAAWYKKMFRKVVITPKILTLILGLLFVAITVAYIIWQVWSINRTPGLLVFLPTDNAVIQSSSIVVSGQTDPGMTVTANDQNIFVDAKGNFQTQVSISPGPKEITITAVNRFGKSATKTLNITGAASLAATVSQVNVKIDFKAAVTLSISLDDQAAQTLSFNTGDTKTFTAVNKILLSTSDAGATFITLNGQSLGAMGKPKEALSGISFYPPTDNASSTK